MVLAELEKLFSEEVRLPENSPFGEVRASKRIIDVVEFKLEI